MQSLSFHAYSLFQRKTNTLWGNRLSLGEQLSGESTFGRNDLLDLPNVVNCLWCGFQHLIFFENFKRGLHGYTYEVIYCLCSIYFLVPLELQQRLIVLCARAVPMSLGVDIDLPC